MVGIHKVALICYPQAWGSKPRFWAAVAKSSLIGTPQGLTPNFSLVRDCSNLAGGGSFLPTPPRSMPRASRGPLIRAAQWPSEEGLRISSVINKQAAGEGVEGGISAPAPLALALSRIGDWRLKKKKKKVLFSGKQREGPPANRIFWEKVVLFFSSFLPN